MNTPQSQSNSPMASESILKIKDTKQIYVAVANTDLTEGRGYNFNLVYATSPETAERLGKGKNIQGSDCPVYSATAYLINDVWYYPGVLVHQESPADSTKRVIREKQEAAIARAKELGLEAEHIDTLLKR